LEYGKLGRIEIEPKPVNVAASVKAASEQIDIALRDNITTSVAPELVVSANTATLTQSLSNLISNGLKFYRPGQTPHVEVTAHREGGNIVIKVSDQGIGIAP